jgi:hypothetical protein
MCLRRLGGWGDSGSGLDGGGRRGEKSSQRGERQRNTVTRRQFWRHKVKG